MTNRTVPSVYVTSIDNYEKTVSRLPKLEPFVVIGVSTNDIDDLPENPCCYDYLHLKFWDVEHGDGHPSYMNEMTEEQAYQVRDFVARYPLMTFVVFCDAGVSRSTAVAAYIRKIHDPEDESVWYHWEYSPNPWVYELLMKVHGTPVSEEEIERLLDINEEAKSVKEDEFEMWEYIHD